MTIDKEKLKVLAEASGSGEWYAAGDLRYCDDKTGEIHGLHHDDSRFIAAASPATVIALLAEIEGTENRLHDVAVLCATVEQERDQLKAENEALRKDAERYRYMRRAWAPHLSQDEADAQTDAAMAKEASHG